MKRQISLFLCIVLVLSLVTVPVFSEDTTNTETVAEIFVTGTMPELEVGQALPEIPLSVEEGAPYEITDYSWRCDDDKEYYENVPVGTVIEEGYRYTLSVEIMPKEGYTLDLYAQMYLNGNNSGFTHGMNDTAHYLDYQYNYLAKVNMVEVTIPEPVFGQAPGEISIPEGAKYRIVYQDWNSNTGDDMTDFVFKDDYYYSLYIMVEAENGYQFPMDTETYVNGELYTDASVRDSKKLIDIFVYYNYEKTPVYSANLMVATPVAGAQANTSVTTNANSYTASAVWTESGSAEPFTGTFKGGKTYDLTLTLTPGDGYKFSSENTRIYLNNKMVTGTMDGKNMVITASYDVAKTAIRYPDIYVTEPIVGELADTTVRTIADTFTASAVWTESGSTEPFTGTFEENKTYVLTLTLTPKENYEFLSNATSVYINDEWVNSGKLDGENLVVTHDFDLRPVRQTVPFSNLPTLTVGEAMPEINLKTDDLIEIKETRWLLDTGTMYDGVVQEARYYNLQVTFVSKDPNTRIKELETYATTPVGSHSVIEYTDGVWMFRIPYSTMRSLPEVNISGIPASLTAGSELYGYRYSVAEENVDVNHYQWYVTDMTTGITTNAYGTVEAGKLYQLNLYLYPYRPYQIDENTVIKFDGDDHIVARPQYNLRDSVIIFYFPVDTAPIDRLDITTVEPTVGGAIDSKNITVAEDANYTLEHSEWLSAADAQGNDATVPTGTFEADTHYGINYLLRPKAGYHFAKNVALYVNGKLVEDPVNNSNLVYEFTGRAMLGAICGHTYTNVCDATCDKCNATRTPADHVYDNACDASCNVCSTSRTPGDHVYDDTYDASCNVCNATREVPPMIQVEGTTANVSSAAMNKAIAEAKDTGKVNLSVSDAASVQLPVASLEDVAEAGATLTLTTKEATVTIDRGTMSAVAAQAESQTVTLEIKKIEQSNLTEQQKTAVAGKDVALMISAEFVSNGKTISDFKGGSVTVTIPFTPETGTDGSDYVVLYVADDGSVEEIATTYVNGCLEFTLKHFSEYVVVNTGSKTPTEPTDPDTDATEPTTPSTPDTDEEEESVNPDVPKTGDYSNMEIWMVMMAVSILCLAMLVAGTKKRMV